MDWPGLLRSRKLSAVPIARYIVVVGSALAVLLLIAGWTLPERTANFPDRSEIVERATIRIRSERRWPEKIILDANRPAFPPPSIEAEPAQQPVEPPPDEMTDQTSVDALARLNTDARPIDARRAPTRAKPGRKALPSAHIARVRMRGEQARLGTSEECCRFEWADRPATSEVRSRKRIARRGIHG